MSRARSSDALTPTVASVLRDRARTDGDREVVRYADGPAWSASELWDATTSAARSLEATIAPGDVVLTAADTGPDAIVITAVVSSLGAVELPLAPDVSPAWANRLIQLTSPVTLLASPQRAAAQRLLQDLSGPGRPLVVVDASTIAARPTTSLTPRPRELTDPALIMSTSGTTGRAKAALLPVGAPIRQAERVASAMGYGPDDVLLNVFAWHHINARNACFLPALMSGARMVVVPRFSASRFLDVARHEQVTAFNFMGALCSMLLSQPPTPHDRDHRIRAAYGGPAPAALVSAFRDRFGVALRQAYACTELADVALTPIDELRPGWAGRIGPDHDVRIVDESLQQVPDGQPGELLVRPRSEGISFIEYVGDRRATRDAWYDGWFRTRDRARLDDGWLAIEGRLGDVIRRRGTNIDPREVEEVLLGHRDVVEAAAVAVPSELTEDEILAVVVLAADRAVEPAVLWAHCRDRLPRHQVPRFFSSTSALPHNDSLKVDRAALRQLGLPSTAWDAQAHVPTATEAQ
ncbi:AMP-binding protein [Nocardioides alcanivorans]|uniref:AMP-binding protein n=1 Tax=Nocardioides alcanivorans TaxID=2897352 RepID=UPI001F3201DA|nr:AMP-binding protein [Nocardioides alcanivorans]